MPGPGTYKLTEGLGGKIATSKYKNPGSPRMQPDYAPAEGKRTKNESPGPGQYILPSDFGRLELYKMK